MPFASTIAAALRTADRLAGVTIQYRRGGDQITIDNVRRGNTRTETDDGQGIVVRGRSQDYLIEAAKLALPNVAHARPEEGDEIRETIGGQTHVYVVRPIGGQAAWTWHDPHCQWFRVHCAHLSTE